VGDHDLGTHLREQVTERVAGRLVEQQQRGTEHVGAGGGLTVAYRAGSGYRDGDGGPGGCVEGERAAGPQLCVVP
jgi:hypothetical protein